MSRVVVTKSEGARGREATVDTGRQRQVVVQSSRPHKPTFTLAKRHADSSSDSNDSQVGQSGLTIAAGGGGRREVQVRSDSAASRIVSTGRGLLIEAASNARRERTVLAGAKKRKSSELSRGEQGTLRRVIVNDGGAMADVEGGAEDSAAVASKRGRFVISKDVSGERQGSSTERGHTFAVHLSGSSGAALSSSSFVALPAAPANLPLPISLPMPGVSVNKAPADRLAITQAKSNGAAGAAMPSIIAAPFAAAAPAAAVPFPMASAAPASSPVSRAAVPASAPLTKVLLRNLSPHVTPKVILTHLFGLYDVRALHLDTQPDSGLCSGTAEAHFANANEAAEAVTICHGQSLFGQPVRVSIITENADSAVVPVQPAQPTPTPTVAPPAAAAAAPSPSPAVPAPVATQAVAASAAAAAAPVVANPLSSAHTNLGFRWDDDAAGDFMNDDTGDTIFNITNLKMSNYQPTPQANNAAPLTLAPATAHSATHAEPARAKQLSVRPKSVLASGVSPAASGPSPLFSASSTGKPVVQLHRAVGDRPLVTSLTTSSSKIITLPTRR